MASAKKQAVRQQWSLTSALCNRDSDCAAIAKLLLALPKVQNWIDSVGDDEDLRDRRACSLIVSVTDLRHNALLKIPKPGEHKKHFAALARDLRKLERKLRRECKHQPLGGRWITPGFADTVAVNASHAETLCEAPALTAKRAGRHGAVNEFIRDLWNWLVSENARTSPSQRQKYTLAATDLEFIADVVGALEDCIDPGDKRTIDAETVKSLVKKRKPRSANSKKK